MLLNGWMMTSVAAGAGAQAGARHEAPPAHVAGSAASVYKPTPTDRDGREVAMQSVAVQHPHLLIWRDPPAWPFLWRGLLPLVALALTASFAAGPVARNWIEGAVQRETREQLDAAGFGWVGLSVSGQNLTLSGEEPAPGSGERAIAVAKAARCATWIGRRACAVSVAGRFTSPAPPASAAAAPPQTAAQACERSLAGVLAGGQIEFASGSAAIDARSGPLLDRLAQEAGSCPGTLRIEGHTDPVGRSAFNRRLSQARAAAVRDALIARGVPAERLRARGFAARRPIADNTTESGRARNRRIEFHVVSAE
ncbi:MAG: OmpA family protein [Gammaproteobacteria bacterium]|nr:MAG: OmpA family protein [Gammaproteobacteria bacterium]TLY87426.1 MAG: OmpA family protein [Gammaproteobacteria bacterium]